MDDESAGVPERGVLTAPGAVWVLAVRRAEVVGRLARSGTVSLDAADAAAAELGVSRRQVYVLLKRWREGDGVVSDLIARRSSGGRGRGRLSDEVEAVIRDLLRTRYLTRQRRSAAAVYRELVRICRSRNLPVPSKGALTRRITQLDPREAATARQGPDAARPLRAAGGVPPPVERPLEQVQIDHTPVDVIVVDEHHRLPIGRPYVTAAIDVFSRCVVGLVVTLEAPSALSVGLCLTHMACDKRVWLEALGAEVSWPMSGKPGELYLDNAAEFKSEALRRGCEQHGIGLRYRPPGRPHYGGIVERLIGTMMQLVHELPGTTFSNPRERGDYDSDARAALTLRELQKWLALAVAVYHGQVHAGVLQTPAGRWVQGVAAAGTPPTVTDGAAFLVDFLPVLRRTLTRTGFQIDHVRYFSNALRPWIARRERLERFVIRRDPRDLSRIWVLDPDGATYLQVPYRALSHPPITLWEQRAAVARLRESGWAEIDEDALFRVVEQMRATTEAATASTRKARRTAARTPTAPPVPPGPALLPPAACPDVPAGAIAAPFETIEEW